jgi:hypothetical protein
VRCGMPPNPGPSGKKNILGTKKKYVGSRSS